MPEGTKDEIDFLDHVHRKTNGARLIHDRTLDALPNPPGGIGRETEATLGVEFLDRVDQAEIALLDEVKQGNTAIEIVLGDVNHEAQVVLDHLLPRQEFPGTGAARPVVLFLCGKERLGANFVEVMLRDVVEQVVLGRRRGTRLLAFARHLDFGLVFLGDAVFGQISFLSRIPGCQLILVDHPVSHVAAVHDQRCGKCLRGSTGLPCRRISKCSLTRSASVLPISAIFCPLVTLCPSSTRMRWLCA